MGAAKDMWMDEQERIVEKFASHELTRDEAVTQLVYLGFNKHEAEDMLDEVQ